MSLIRGEDFVFVGTYAELGAVFIANQDRVFEGKVVILVVPDGATFEQRLEMAKLATK